MNKVLKRPTQVQNDIPFQPTNTPQSPPNPCFHYLPVLYRLLSLKGTKIQSISPTSYLSF